MKNCIFIHGAGGTLSAPTLQNSCAGYAQIAPFFAFQGSMNLTARVKGFHACLSHIWARSNAESKAGSVEKEHGADKIVLGGRSMGARTAVMAASEILESSSPGRTLVLASYPVKGTKNEVRDKILLDLPGSVRVLFIVGNRDAICPFDLLDRTRKEMAAQSKSVVIKGADHGMHVWPKEKERGYGEEAGRLAATWVGGEMKEDVVHVGQDGGG